MALSEPPHRDVPTVPDQMGARIALLQRAKLVQHRESRGVQVPGCSERNHLVYRRVLDHARAFQASRVVRLVS